MGTVALRVSGGAKRYHHDGHALPVFEGIDLAVGQGEIFALLGPSGCGKSTLLRVLAGLEPLSAGQVEVAAPPAPERGGGGRPAGHDGNRRRAGLVFQDPSLFPWLTVAENVGLGLRYHANRGARAAESVERALHDFGLTPVAHAYPHELSGGQAQRVSLARTVVTRPAIILLDEPFGSLDPRTRRQLQDWLLDVVRQRGLTALLVTHDVDEALYLGDRVALMSSRPGTILRTWDITRARADSGEGADAGRHARDGDLSAIRRDILARYQAVLPAPPAGANWVI